MSILSGYKKFKKYLKTADGYQLISYFTSSDTVNMVDENGNITDTTLTESINQVGKGRELTQAEYDALSEEEKKNGTVYYITDDDGVVSVVALTRKAYDALGDATSTDGRIYLITDENSEETAKNIGFDDSNTTIEATTVHQAIENIDSSINLLTSNIETLSANITTLNTLSTKLLVNNISTNTSSPFSLSDSIKNYNYLFIEISADNNIYSLMIPVFTINNNYNYFYNCKYNDEFYVNGHIKFNSNSTVTVTQQGLKGWTGNPGRVKIWGIK